MFCYRETYTFYYRILLLKNSQVKSNISHYLGVGKIFDYLWNRAICFLFCFSRPFNENFLKNCPYDIHEILHSPSPKGAPACAKASKSYDWNVRNIAKISSKMAKKQPFFDFLRFPQKISIPFEQKFLQSFCTIIWSYVCNRPKNRKERRSGRVQFSQAVDNNLVLVRWNERVVIMHSYAKLLK